mmetsp:Transcript_21026/g.53899  ORF Transcript_21026/g.53899 Transcript_21026/m.53899 type:complete len:220 (+) Transcript_21026:1178-1837(+)
MHMSNGITSASKVVACPMERGKPSSRKAFLPLDIMAFFSRLQPTVSGTRPPCFITSAHVLPSSLPEATSARSRSPEERWWRPYLATSFSLRVPLPLPGPPRMTTATASAGREPSTRGTSGKTGAASAGGPSSAVLARPSLADSFSSTSFTVASITSSGDCSAETMWILAALPKKLVTGDVSSWNVLKRFMMVSSLSSARPLVLPRPSSRSFITPSEHSR